jgi:uncharacterized protein YdeI (YjbR/CyaY-like superfamily)
MPRTPVPHDVLFFATPESLRDWFDANHATAGEQWVGYWRKGSGRPSITWEQAVDEALCVGWIDGVRLSVDGGFVQRFTPRRPRSTWSARNVGRVEALRAEGRMRPAGLAAYEARLPELTETYGFEQAEAAFDEATRAAFQARPGAWAFFEAQPPGYRRSATQWVTSAKRVGTREQRLATLIEDSAAGRRVGILSRPTPR